MKRCGGPEILGTKRRRVDEEKVLKIWGMERMRIQEMQAARKTMDGASKKRW